MEFRYNCLSPRYKQPFGCVKAHETCKMMVEISTDVPVYSLAAIIEDDHGVVMTVPFVAGAVENGFHQFHGRFVLPRCDLFFYHFQIDVGGGIEDWYRFCDVYVSREGNERWQITCYPEDFTVPEAFSGAVMYQIFPDRFFKGKNCDLTGKLEPYWIHDNWYDTPNFRPDEHGEVLNNDFFGGNLDGIRQKLDYLKSLHVDIIYLNPVCMGYSNHRYDTADYKRVDPMLGNDADFTALCEAAHSLGMKVIIDGVYSHTGSNSVYFDKKGAFGGNGAYTNPRSPYRSWFDFQRYPNKYTSWWGIATLPCVNEMDETYLDFMIRNEDSVVAHWLSLGADGFRLDVADELPDAFISMFRKRVKEINPDAIVLGEVWEDASNKIAYDVRRRYFSDGELDAVMNYPFRTAILDFMKDGDAASFRHVVMSIVEHYPAPVLHCLMNSLSTHDTPRILSLLGQQIEGGKEERSRFFMNPDAREWAAAREVAAAILQFTLPGMSSIYYGDEAGLEGFEDPFNRRCYPWHREDQDLLAFYRKLSGFKAEYQALRIGNIHFHSSAENVIDFTREWNDQKVRTIVNGGEAPIYLPKDGRVLFLHFGRQNLDSVMLNQWGAALILEN